MLNRPFFYSHIRTHLFDGRLLPGQVKGIEGECGGVCSCATCHIYIDPAWMDKVGPASKVEQGMLDLEDHASKCSRLGCQVKLTPELDGLIVKVVGR